MVEAQVIEQKKAQISELKGRIEQFIAGATSWEHVQQEIVKQARPYIVGALVAGLLLGLLVGHYIPFHRVA